MKKFHLKNLEFKGLKKSNFCSSQCIFSSIKFSETSKQHKVNIIYNLYNILKESYFHILILIYSEESLVSAPVLLFSKISSPIFVNSRKSTNHQLKIKVNFIILSF